MNPYLVLSTADRETEFTRTIAYWLNPYESHGLGLESSTKFLEVLAQKAIQQPTSNAKLIRESSGDPVRAVQTELRLNLANQIDLVLTSAAARFFIEVKLWALEQEDQIQRYLAAAASFSEGKRCFVIFLTPNGRAPTSVSKENADQVVCLSFEDIDRWLSALVTGRRNLDQAIGLAQLLGWVRYVIDSFNRPITENFRTDQLRAFWSDVRDKLEVRMRGAGIIGWSVRFSRGSSMVDEVPAFDEAYSKLGYVHNAADGYKRPMVVFEGIEGSKTGFYGVRNPLGWREKLAGSEDDEAKLNETLLTNHFRKDKWYLGRRYFGANGWPKFEPGDHFTSTTLSQSSLGPEIADQLVDSLFLLFKENQSRLEQIRFAPV